jgi:hypothetical protein
VLTLSAHTSCQNMSKDIPNKVTSSPCNVRTSTLEHCTVLFHPVSQSQSAMVKITSAPG